MKRKQPKLDLSRVVEIADHDQENWEPFVVIHEAHDHLYGHLEKDSISNADRWNFDVWRFRNKPAAALRIIGWANIYKSVQDDGRIYYQFGEIWKTREEAEECDTRDICVAIVYVDVYEGHGLEVTND